MNASKHPVRAIALLLATITLWLALPSLALAQETSAEQNAKDTSDKTGTNPINFQRDLRFYNEYSWLNTAGDGNQNVFTTEYRQALFDGAWQFRGRVRYTSVTADFNNDGIDDVDETGLGDSDFRLLTVPFFKGANAIALAVEVFLDTASDDALGSGTTALGPQIFYGRFFGKNPIPIPYYTGGGFFAPGLQYKFSIDEDAGRAETEQILIDLNFIAMAPDKTAWFFTNPQIVVDLENDVEFALFDMEFGWMNKKRKGQSWYIRPTFSIGADRPTDYGIEFGYKFVGW